MKNEEILLNANEGYKLFSKKFKIQQPMFKTMSKKEFEKYLKDSQNHPNINTTPCFVAHLPEGNLIVFSKKITNQILKIIREKLNKNIKAKEFIKALTLHELLHIYNKTMPLSYEESIKSEKMVNSMMKKYFSKYSRILNEVEKCLYLH